MTDILHSAVVLQPIAELVQNDRVNLLLCLDAVLRQVTDEVH